MPGHYLDSSAIAKFYHPEMGSASVERILLDRSFSIFISRLAVVEVQSVFAGKVRIRAISFDDASVLHRRFVSDIAQGLFGVIPLVGEDFNLASRLIESHGATQGLRSLDALQLAVALKLRGAGIIEDFVVSDKVLCRVAALEGLAVVNPECAA